MIYCSFILNSIGLNLFKIIGMAKFSESISKNFSSRGSSAILAIALYKKIKSDFKSIKFKISI